MSTVGLIALEAASLHARGGFETAESGLRAEA